MIDGLKCSCVGLDGGLWANNPLLNFVVPVSETTGELMSLKKEAIFNNLHFIQSSYNSKTSCSIFGSLHKFRSANGINWDAFTHSDLCGVLDYLEANLNVPLSDSVLHSLEIGVNIPLNYSPKRLIKSVICHKGKPFDSISKKGKFLGVICERTDYTIKLYDKGYQTRIDRGFYVLRFEVKFKRMRMLEPYGVRTLADLKDVEKVLSMGRLLLEKLDEMIFFDFNSNSIRMTPKQRLNWERYSNPKYWEELDRKQYYKSKMKFTELTEKYSAKNIGANLKTMVSDLYLELCQSKQQKGGRFPQINGEKKAQKKGTFSDLECVLENVAFGSGENSLFFVSDYLEEKRCCKSCGRDISIQKDGSCFCSEKYFGKEAKKCRNRDSNKRMVIKRKIKNAMDKKQMLRITYSDESGTPYTDILGVDEISITREWLNRVQKVEIIKPQPEILQGYEAKKLLLTI